MKFVFYEWAWDKLPNKTKKKTKSADGNDKIVLFDMKGIGWLKQTVEEFTGTG